MSLGEEEGVRSRRSPTGEGRVVAYHGVHEQIGDAPGLAFLKVLGSAERLNAKAGRAAVRNRNRREAWRKSRHSGDTSEWDGGKQTRVTRARVDLR